jgi:hypothetical protein
MVARDRFRGTAAHSTVVIDGAEQSPLIEGRPFALLDRAAAPRVQLEDVGERASVAGAHDGYRRLPARLRHRRRVALHRTLDVLEIDDQLIGRGHGSVELRYHLAAPARLGIPESARARVTQTARALGLELDGACLISVGNPVRAVLIQMPVGLAPELETGQFSPRYGAVEEITLVTFRARLIFPASLKTAWIRLESE